MSRIRSFWLGFLGLPLFFWPLDGTAAPPRCRGLQTVAFCRQALPTGTTTVTCYERQGLAAQVPALDLTPLGCLPQLESLTLASGEIEFVERLKLGGLGPLLGLPRLRRLALEETSLSDLAPLSGLRGLEVLSVHASPVQDLSPLAALSQLRELDLSCTKVRDLSPLRTLTRLQRLDLTRTEVRDLTILAELPALTWLGLADDAPIAKEARQALIARRPDLVIAAGRRY